MVVIKVFQISESRCLTSGVEISFIFRRLTSVDRGGLSGQVLKGH